MTLAYIHQQKYRLFLTGEDKMDAISSFVRYWCRFAVCLCSCDADCLLAAYKHAISQEVAPEDINENTDFAILRKKTKTNNFIFKRPAAKRGLITSLVYY